MWRACPWWIPLLLAGCSTVSERTPFRAVDDLRTTTPRHLAEAGHADVVLPPAGVRFALELEAVHETPRRGMASQRYELTLHVEQDPGLAASWRPDVHGCRLVDDEGHTLAPAQIHRQVGGDQEPGDASQSVHKIRFDLPLSYRVRQISRVTVHWSLIATGRKPARISSRFVR